MHIYRPKVSFTQFDYYTTLHIGHHFGSVGGDALGIQYDKIKICAIEILMYIYLSKLIYLPNIPILYLPTYLF